jgi:GAF domain-containing protein
VIGVINVESAQIEAFSQADEHLLGIIAGQLSTAIERLRGETGIQKRIQELQAITQISSEVSTVLDQQRLLELIARHAAEISTCDGCGIFTLHPDGRLHLDASYGVGEEFAGLLSTEGVPMEGTAVGRAYTTLQPCQIPDIYRAEEEYATIETADIEGIRAVLAIPMRLGEEVIGGIVLWDRQPRRFSPEEERFLQALANQSVNALENARLFERERQQRQLAEVLRETGSALSATLDFDAVLDRLLEQLARIVPYDAASVMLVEEGCACVARLKIQTTSDQDYYRAAENLRIEIAATESLRRMVETRAPVIIPDVRSDANWQDFIETSPIRSWAGAPILIENDVAAFFGLDSQRKNFFQPDHLKTLEIFATQAGLALQNALLFEETQRRLREITLLSKIIQLTSMVEDPETALNQACREITHFFNSQQAALALLEPQRDHLTVIAEHLADSNQASLIGVSIPTSNNPAMTHMLEHKAPLAVSDVQGDPLLEPVRELFQLRDTASALFIPLLSQGEVNGVLGIGTLEQRTFSPEEIELIQNLSRQASQALERVQLYNETRSQAERMTSLAALSHELNRPMSVDEVIEGIGRGAMALGGTSRAAVFLHSVDEATYCPWFEGLAGQYIKAVTEEKPRSPQNIFTEKLLHQADAILINDIRDLPEQASLRLLADGEAYRGIGLFPLVYEGSVIASVGLYFDRPQPWNASQKEIMLAFTRQAAVALQTARLFDETRRRALQQEALNGVVAAGVAAPNLTILLNTVLDLTLHALGMTKGAIWVKEHHAIRGFPEDIGLDSQRITGERGGTRPQTIALNDLYQGIPGDLPDLWKKDLEKHDVHALLTVPVMTGGERIGAMSIASPVPHRWLGEEIALAQAVGRQLGSATERFELVAKSQEQARQVQQIIETVPEGVLVLDDDQRITLANPAAQSYLAVLNPNHSPDTPLNQLGGIAIGELLVAQSEKPWRELKTDSIPTYIFEIAARPLETRSLKEGWVLVLRDVTLERENQTRAQMRERLATVGQLAAGIAHDFNNIMAAIVVYADLLSMEPGLSRDGRDRLKTIQQQIARASDLIRQILDFSRRSVMERSPIDLLPLIKELEKLLGRVLPENIQRELNYQPGVYMVNADPTHLQQVFMNLALNARDAMPSGGTLSISLGHIKISPDDPQMVRDLSPGDWICITMRDTGIGIPAEALPHIFDPFFTTKPVGQGTGLGLAQVYGIIQQHGGSIDVQSGAEEGTTFHIYLPELITPDDDAKTTLLETSQRGAGETLLLVEDDQPARRALQELLESQGYNILIARNGVEAVQVFEENVAAIEAIISDVVMPKMGGIELYHTLKKSQPGIKFLLITGHPLDDDERVPLEKGVVEWLHKPFPVNEFLAVVQNLLEP